MPTVAVDGLNFEFPSTWETRKYDEWTEQPSKHSTLRPGAINPADVQQALRRRLKPIDAHPFVAETSRMGSLAWKVT